MLHKLLCLLVFPSTLYQQNFKKYFHTQTPFTCMVRVVNCWLTVTENRKKEKRNEMSKMTHIFCLIDFDAKLH